jgi:NitT/TauT family transport system ATP-binding protein
VVLSARPARVQHAVEVGLGPDREIAMLYQPDAVAMLADLRHQIQIAQGRAA